MAAEAVAAAGEKRLCQSLILSLRPDDPGEMFCHSCMKPECPQCVRHLCICMPQRPGNDSGWCTETGKLKIGSPSEL